MLTRTNFEEQGQFSVNGQRPNANYFTVDGVSANFAVSAGAAPGQAAAGGLPALTALGGTNNLASVDAVEEFRVHTFPFAPEFGRMPGAQVSIVTRSGTNEFHGAVFEHFRNEALDANDWFANKLGLLKPAVRQHDFGGVLGGPLIRDSLFFFASYEGLQLRQPQVGFMEVPSLTARAAAPAQIKPFLNAYPLPNGRETGSGLAEFAASYSEPSRYNAVSIRVDHFPTNRLTLFGRFNIAPSEVEQRGSVIRSAFTAQPLFNPTVALSLSTTSHTSLQTETLTAGASYAFGTNIVNEIRANLSRNRGNTEFGFDTFGGAQPLPLSILFPTGKSNSNASFQLSLERGIASNLATGRYVDNQQRQLNLVDHLSIARDSHQLKFGIDYRRLMPIYSPVNYNQLATFRAVEENNVAGPGTLESGVAETVHIFGGAQPRHALLHNLSAYAQDAWRVSSKLLLTYGLRWELNTPPVGLKGNHPLALRRLTDLQQLLLGDPGTPLWRTTYYNFAPRFGLAWRLSSREGRELTFRSGAGLFYDLGTGQAAQGFGSVAPFVNVRRFNNIHLPLTPAQAQPLPNPGSIPLFPLTLVIFDPELKLPRSYQWNAALDQSLGSQQKLRVAYVGALGRSLLREDVVVGLGAASSVVRLTRNGAKSSYHALQVQATRRLTRGFQAVAAFTWAHSIDDASSDGLTIFRPAGIFSSADMFGGGRGSSDFDVRHSFSFGATYDLPKPAATSAAKGLLSDWSMDALFYARTATPINVVSRTEVVGTNVMLALARPDFIAGVPVYISDPNAGGGRRINPAAFRPVAAGKVGSLGQNALRGFGASQLDLTLRRQISLSEKLRIQLRGEVFNLLNHPNFGNPIGDLSNPRFGQSTQSLARSLGSGGINGGLRPIYQIGGARSVQLAVKLIF